MSSEIGFLSRMTRASIFAIVLAPCYLKILACNLYAVYACFFYAGGEPDSLGFGTATNEHVSLKIYNFKNSRIETY